MNTIIDWLQATFPISRVVALLTPVLAAVAGWLATRLGELGFEPDEAQMTALFVSGAAAAIAAGYKWLDGRQKWEVATLVSQNPLDVPADIAESEGDAPDDPERRDRVETADPNVGAEQMREVHPPRE